MKRLFAILICLFFLFNIKAQEIKISSDISVYKISEHAYIHVSWFNSPQFGSYASNGLIYCKNEKAILFDTPVNDSLTAILLNWIQSELHDSIVAFVPNHWHIDCMGGLNYIQKARIISYANIKTINIAKEKGLPVPEVSFQDSLVLHLDDSHIICIFPGEAHTKDNIAVYIPEEKILFGGCIVKEFSSPNLGNTADGNIEAYAATIKKLMESFSSVQIVIPGHGKWGGKELLQHTLDLAQGTK